MATQSFFPKPSSILSSARVQRRGLTQAAFPAPSKRASVHPEVIFSGIQPSGQIHVRFRPFSLSPSLSVFPFLFFRIYLKSKTLPPSPPPFPGPHTLKLGNYLGALTTWVNLQQTAPPTTDIYYSLVGLHAITIPKDPKKLLKERREMLATLLACGINEDRSCLYFQDMVRSFFCPSSLRVD